MTEQRTSPEQRQALRARYLANPGSAYCSVCRETMELLPPEWGTIGALWTWRCPRASEHPRLRYIDHYADLDVIAAVDDADALAGARAEVGRLRALLVEITRLTDAASEATMTRSTLDVAWRVARIAERHMPVTMEEADAPGQGQEGEGQ